jgi:hypothetical protein
VPANYVPEASVIRRAQTLPGLIGRKEMRRRFNKFVVKSRGSTSEKHQILLGLRKVKANGIPGGAVKCVDIGRNTSGEGGLLGLS